MRRIIYGSLSALTAVATVFVAAKAEVFGGDQGSPVDTPSELTAAEEEGLTTASQLPQIELGEALPQAQPNAFLGADAGADKDSSAAMNQLLASRSSGTLSGSQPNAAAFESRQVPVASRGMVEGPATGRVAQVPDTEIAPTDKPTTAAPPEADIEVEAESTPAADGVPTAPVEGTAMPVAPTGTITIPASGINLDAPAGVTASPTSPGEVVVPAADTGSEDMLGQDPEGADALETEPTIEEPVMDEPMMDESEMELEGDDPTEVDPTFEDPAFEDPTLEDEPDDDLESDESEDTDPDASDSDDLSDPFDPATGTPDAPVDPSMEMEPDMEPAPGMEPAPDMEPIEPDMEDSAPGTLDDATPAPVSPGAPVTPSTPVTPVEPVTPVPATPGTPVTPSEPVTPVEPGTPLSPEADPSMTPDGPIEEPLPATPAEPVPAPLPDDPGALPPVEEDDGFSDDPSEPAPLGSTSDRLIGEGFSPFQLTYLAIYGGLSEAGIPGGNFLLDDYDAGEVSAADVVDAGAMTKRLGTDADDLDAYIADVDNFLMLLLRDNRSL